MHTNDIVLCMAACFLFGAGTIGVTIKGEFGFLIVPGLLLLVGSLISSHDR